MPTRWPRRGVRVRQRINKDPSGPDCEALRRAYCYSAALPVPVLRLVVESIPFVGRSPHPSLRFLSYRGPAGLCSSIDVDGVPTLHLPIHPSGTRCRTLHRTERIRCADVVGFTVAEVLDRVRCIRVYRHRVMSIVPCRLRAEAVPLSVPFGAQVMDIVSTYANGNDIPSKVFPHFPVLAAAPGQNFFCSTRIGGAFRGIM